MQKAQRIFCVTGALMGWAVLLLQLYLMLQNRDKDVFNTVINFLSFYTILTNLFVALYFSVLFLGKPGRVLQFAEKASVATGLALHISIVGIVYQLLLRNLWDPQGLQLLADNVLHGVVPCYFVLYWIVIVPKQGIGWADIPGWLLYPVIYLVYTLIHGMITGFYPYPFLDVNRAGLMRVITNASFLTICFIVLAAVFVAISKLLSRNKTT